MKDYRPDSTLRDEMDKLAAELERRDRERSRPLPPEDGLYRAGDDLWSYMVIRHLGRWYPSWRREELEPKEFQRLVLEAPTLVRLVPEKK